MKKSQTELHLKERRKSKGYWNGLKGLVRAKSDLIGYIKSTNELPRSEDFYKIKMQANLRTWQEFGIKTWTDLLKSCVLDLQEKEFEFGISIRKEVLRRFKLYI